jgi:hypothetical protein
MTVGSASDTWSVTTGAQMVTFAVGQQNEGYGYPCSAPSSFTAQVGTYGNIPIYCPDPYYPGGSRCADNAGNDIFYCGLSQNGDNFTLNCGPIPANISGCRFWGSHR